MVSTGIVVSGVPVVLATDYVLAGSVLMVSSALIAVQLLMLRLGTTVNMASHTCCGRTVSCRRGRSRTGHYRGSGALLANTARL